MKLSPGLSNALSLLKALSSGKETSQLLRLSLWATLLAVLAIFVSQSWESMTTWHRISLVSLLTLHGVIAISRVISRLSSETTRPSGTSQSG